MNVPASHFPSQLDRKADPHATGPRPTLPAIRGVHTRYTNGRVVEEGANTTVSVPMTVIRESENDSVHVGELFFVRRRPMILKTREPNTAQLPVHARSISSMNHHLYMHGSKYKTAESVLSEWSLMGGVVAVTPPDTGTRAHHRSMGVTVCIQKRVRVFNVWFISLPTRPEHAGSKLFLVLRRFQMSDPAPNIAALPVVDNASVAMAMSSDSKAREYRANVQSTSTDNDESDSEEDDDDTPTYQTAHTTPEQKFAVSTVFSISGLDLGEPVRRRKQLGEDTPIPVVSYSSIDEPTPTIAESSERPEPTRTPNYSIPHPLRSLFALPEVSERNDYEYDSKRHVHEDTARRPSASLPLLSEPVDIHDRMPSSFNYSVPAPPRSVPEPSEAKPIADHDDNKNTRRSILNDTEQRPSATSSLLLSEPVDVRKRIPSSLNYSIPSPPRSLSTIPEVQPKSDYEYDSKRHIDEDSARQLRRSQLISDPVDLQNRVPPEVQLRAPVTELEKKERVNAALGTMAQHPDLKQNEQDLPEPPFYTTEMIRSILDVYDEVSDYRNDFHWYCAHFGTARTQAKLFVPISQQLQRIRSSGDNNSNKRMEEAYVVMRRAMFIRPEIPSDILKNINPVSTYTFRELARDINDLIAVPDYPNRDSTTRNVETRRLIETIIDRRFLFGSSLNRYDHVERMDQLPPEHQYILKQIQEFYPVDDFQPRPLQRIQLMEDVEVWTEKIVNNIHSNAIRSYRTWLDQKESISVVNYTLQGIQSRIIQSIPPAKKLVLGKLKRERAFDEISLQMYALTRAYIYPHDIRIYQLAEVLVILFRVPIAMELPTQEFLSTEQLNELYQSVVSLVHAFDGGRNSDLFRMASERVILDHTRNRCTRSILEHKSEVAQQIVEMSRGKTKRSLTTGATRQRRRQQSPSSHATTNQSGYWQFVPYVVDGSESAPPIELYAPLGSEWVGESLYVGRLNRIHNTGHKYNRATHRFVFPQSNSDWMRMSMELPQCDIELFI